LKNWLDALKIKCWTVYWYYKLSSMVYQGHINTLYLPSFIAKLFLFLIKWVRHYWLNIIDCSIATCTWETKKHYQCNFRRGQRSPQVEERALWPIQSRRYDYTSYLSKGRIIPKKIIKYRGRREIICHVCGKQEHYICDCKYWKGVKETRSNFANLVESY